MLEAERAWVVMAHLAGQRQVEIADSFQVSQTVICTAIKRFCDDWSDRDVRTEAIYNANRRAVALQALERWFLARGEQPTEPVLGQHLAANRFDLALNEHVWLLRCEGLTYREIGERVGLSRERVRQKIYGFGRRHVRRALRRARFRLETV